MLAPSAPSLAFSIFHILIKIIVAYEDFTPLVPTIFS